MSTNLYNQVNIYDLFISDVRDVVSSKHQSEVGRILPPWIIWSTNYTEKQQRGMVRHMCRVK